MIVEVSRRSGDAGTVFLAISLQVPQVVNLQDHLQKTLTRQAGQNREVLFMFQNLERLSKEIREGSSEMEQGTKMILEEMNRLVRVSQEVQGSMNEISQGTEEINSSIHSISSLTVGNKDSIDQVESLTSRFVL